MSTNLDFKLRLSEIARKSAELSAASSKLADMASQLDRLRKLNGGMEFPSDRHSPCADEAAIAMLRARFRHN